MGVRAAVSSWRRLAPETALLAAKISPIVQVDGHPVGDARPEPVTRDPAKAFRNITEGHVGTVMAD